MLKKYILLLLAVMFVLAALPLQAGNPDRQGEAGANQLLVNPWARSAGFHSGNIANISGAEAMYLNVAGVSRVEKTQIQIAHTRYLSGAELNLNALGFAQRIGKSGSFGLSLVSFDLGTFITTTVDVPEGSGATFSPSFFNMALCYSHLFGNKVSVGIAAKLVNESISNVRATAVCLDAGVQYVSGDRDNFKFGISLRNVGSKMQFRGEGLSQARPADNATFTYPVTFYQRSSAYELPSQLNIGFSYDWYIGRVNRLTGMAAFTSNAFSRDQATAGVEFAMNQLFALRVSYKQEFDTPVGSTQATLDNGVAAGFSVGFPIKKGSSTRISLDYGYRFTEIYEGTHNFSLRLDL